MAQVLAVPGDRRHGFDHTGSFFHDFGRITGIAVSKENNVLLCDYIKNQLFNIVLTCNKHQPGKVSQTKCSLTHILNKY
jgi:hypothetical protein